MGSRINTLLKTFHLEKLHYTGNFQDVKFEYDFSITNQSLKKEREKTQRVIREGLQIEKKNGKNYNNFPKLSENPVCHVRPHARNSKDTYELPDGRKYPKQCFWLNNSYILSQLDKKFIGD